MRPMPSTSTALVACANSAAFAHRPLFRVCARVQSVPITKAVVGDKVRALYFLISSLSHIPEVAGVVAAAAPAVPAPLIIPNWVPPPPPAPVHAGQQPAAPAPAPPAQAVPPPAPAPPAQAVPPPVAPPAQAVPPPAPAPAVAPPPAPQQAATVTVTAPNVMPTAAMIDPALLAAPHLPVRRARSTYRQSVSPIYLARFQSSDSAQITLAEDANDEMRFNQQLAHTKMLEFWDVVCPSSSYYHLRFTKRLALL